MNQSRFPNVFEMKKGKRKVFLTKSIDPGRKVYTEDLVKDGKDEYRIWDSKKSKLCFFTYHSWSPISIIISTTSVNIL